MVKELDFDEDAEPELRCPYCGEPAEVDVDPGGADAAPVTYGRRCVGYCSRRVLHLHAGALRELLPQLEKTATNGRDGAPHHLPHLVQRVPGLAEREK